MSTQVTQAVMQGGLNVVTPWLSLAPGEAVQLDNYEVNDLGRYRRIMGYERFDGRTRPSTTTVVTLGVADAALVTVGATITGGTSGATALVVDADLDTDLLALGDVVGSFQNGESIGATTVQTRPDPDDDLLLVFTEALHEHYRALIQGVPGSGPIRGVVLFDDDVYAFRNADPATECFMYKATTSGWALVTTPTLVASGSYRFVVDNFAGSAGTRALYGVDGKNAAFQFDGTTFTQLSTGMVTDTPSSIAVLPSKALVLGYDNGSLMVSAVGDPTDFTVISGGLELAVGDTITDLLVLPSGVMAIFCRTQLKLLYGSVPSEFEVKNLTSLVNSVGVKPYSVQALGDAIFCSEYGISKLSRVQEFGNFRASALSAKVKPILDAYQGTVRSFVVRAKNQYRLCFDDGTGLILTFAGDEIAGFSTFRYPVVVRTAFAGLTLDGEEQVYFGSDDGYVYQAEAGNNFDGGEMLAVCRTAFNGATEQYPQYAEHRKRFKKIVLELSSDLRSPIAIVPELDYNSAAAVQHPHIDLTVHGRGGYFDSESWDEIQWTTAPVSMISSYVEGVGRNVSLVVFSTSTYEYPHTLNSWTVHWSLRARDR